MISQASSDDTLQAVKDAMRAMLWLYDLPTGLMALILVGAVLITSLSGLYFIHPRVHASPLANLVDNSTVGWFFSGVSLLYGLLLGLLTVATWGNFSQAQNIASQEAASISVVYRDLSGYPKPQQDQLKKQLRDYTSYIIEKSWPAQRRGMTHSGEGFRLKRFQDSLFTQELRTEGQVVLHSETIGAFNRMVELRRQRIDSIRGSVPGVLWGVVLFGALITIVFSYFFVVQDYRFHATLTGMLSLMIGLLIFLLVALDHPYWGEVSIGPDAYELILKTVMQQ